MTNLPKDETLSDDEVKKQTVIPLNLPKAQLTVVGTSGDYLAESQTFMADDLARSGLVPADMGCTADVANMESKADRRRLITASYLIPFYDLNGEKLDLMCRRRRRLAPGSDLIKDLGKYTQPHTTMAGGQSSIPYLHPIIWDMDHGGTLHLCEGEKKTRAVIKHAGVVAIGLTGKDVSNRTVEFIAEATRKLGGITRICIWPDADVQRFDVARSYGRLRARLLSSFYDMPGINIQVIQPSWDVRKFKGIDDALVGGWKFAIGDPVGEELPVDIKGLADQIGLDYSTGTKGDGFNLTINEDNVSRILEHQPSWGELRLNSDNGRWLAGDEELGEHDIAAMDTTRRLQRVFGMRKTSNDLVGRTLDYVCRKSPHSPWANWLGGLGWDGVPRLGGWLSRACGALPGDTFVEEVGTKWLVSVVARTMNPGCAVDWMMILTGPQGCGKSSVVKSLFPSEFSDLQMLAPHAQDKDLQAAAGRCRVLCFDEMAVFFKKQDDIEFIKQFVTAPEDVFRPPYGKAEIRRLRGCVLYGSTNRKNDILKWDDSGQRRYCIVEVRGVVEKEGVEAQFDWTWLEANREQLWAEAVALYRGGLDVSQVQGASERSRAYVRRSPLYENFMKILHIDWKSFKEGKKEGLAIEERKFGLCVSKPSMELRYRSVFSTTPYGFDSAYTSFFGGDLGCERKENSKGSWWILSEEWLNAPE